MNNKMILDNFVNKTKKLLLKYDGAFTEPASFNNKYYQASELKWTFSFLTGMATYSYLITKDNYFKEKIEEEILDLKERLTTNPLNFDHDLGFLFMLSANAYDMAIGNKYEDLVVKAADVLKGRFIDKAGVIKAWGKLDDGKDTLIIIDTFMNLPLLYKAYRITKDDSYLKVAKSHLYKAIDCLIRSDYTTYHCYLFNKDTGEKIKGLTHQGYADESCWARGQAWGVYGLMLSYRYLKDEFLVRTSEKLLDVFIKNLPTDFIAPWDFSINNKDRVLKDASANAIVMLGILELLNCDLVSEENKNKYLAYFVKMKDSLIKNDYLSFASNEDGILRHSVYNLPKSMGVNEFTMWGDYFIFEVFAKIEKIVPYDFW